MSVLGWQLLCVLWIGAAVEKVLFQLCDVVNKQVAGKKQVDRTHIKMKF